MASAKTYPVQLTYAELELLVKATHSGNAEMYADDRAGMRRAASIRQKISDRLNEIDATRASDAL